MYENRPPGEFLRAICLARKLSIEKNRKTTQAAKKLLTSIKEKGPLGKKSPFTKKGM